MSQLEVDIKSAVNQLVNLAVGLTKSALAHSDYADQLMRKAEVVCACAELPGDWPLRVFLTPGCLGFKA